MNQQLKAKKFGAFAGVFTPSLLTILGVIMYMRLGWVVGHAGLINALIIILLAHIISFTTGLSVSSIATDKKIKAGGIYYVLSRSLGLPIGGAIGISLVIGTALSISLYLVGFAESFLSIDLLRNFLGLEPSINSYRIIGTMAIMVLLIIAYISTSFAIRTQFYILGAIALSLISIGIGLITQTDGQASGVLTFPAEEGLSLEVLFAVFFPAVTGFTAGIAMSGDLKDSGKAIPRGTLAAIGVGFVVYVGLAIGFAVFVDRDLLINDTNFLLQVSWIAPLVIAGIWGATLSSALGGILGGPRITQAMAHDKIGPRLLAKGYGINNEPRTALLFVFLIAEAGILIGDLNVIARIVTMFYLASYGFINLAFFLESLSSVDFRPRFKVNKYVGLVGFFVAFGMMFKLDFLAMIVALLLMAGLYFYLKRRQLKLEYGDVWQSVWLTLTRFALSKMEASKAHDSKWLPNIILFSGATPKRPHLIELGKSLVGKQGILSNFDLVEQPDSKELFPKSHHALPDEFQESGMFARRQTVNNIYAGIEMIAQTYGFSGIEPNTVMLGWANETSSPEGFTKLLNTFNSLDLSIILVRYDQMSGFGKYKTIDCWINDQSNNSTLALSITKLLLISEKWNNALPRILIVNNKNDRKAEITRWAEILLENLRLNAQVEVINNQLEKKDFLSIVQETSHASDLVLLEIPKLEDGSVVAFIDEQNKLLEKIGTVIMVSASSEFRKIDFLQKESKPVYIKPTKTVSSKSDPFFAPETPENELLIDHIGTAWNTMQAEIKKVFETSFVPLLQYRIDKAAKIRQLLLKTQQTLAVKLPKQKANQKVHFIHQMKSGMLSRISGLIEEQIGLLQREKTDYLQPAINQLLAMGNKMLPGLDEKITIPLTAYELNKAVPKSLGMKIFTMKQKLHFKVAPSKRNVPYNIKFRKLAKGAFSNDFYRAANEAMNAFNYAQLRLDFEYRKLIYASNDAFNYLERHANDTLTDELLHAFQQTIEEPLEEIIKQTETQTQEMQTLLFEQFGAILSGLGKAASGLHPNHFIKSPKRRKTRKKHLHLIDATTKWAWQQEILLHTIFTEAQLMLIEARLNRLIEEGLDEIKSELVLPLTSQLHDLDIHFSKLIIQDENSDGYSPKSIQSLFNYQEIPLQDKLNRIFEKILRNSKIIQKNSPEKVKLFTEESLNGLTSSQLAYSETLILSVSRMLDNYIQGQLMEPFFEHATQLLETLLKAAAKVDDSVRLVSLNMQTKSLDSASQNIDNAENWDTLIAEQQQLVKQQLEAMENAESLFKSTIFDQLKYARVIFSVYGLVRSAEKSGQVKHHKISSKHSKKIKQLRQNAFRALEHLQARYWHSQSDARLMTERLTNVQTTWQHPLSAIIQLKEQCSPAKDTFNKLPFYYKQLFMGKLNDQTTLWVGREVELEMARKALQYYKSGSKGLVTITGEPGSGKSFFVSYLVSRYLPNRKVFFVQPTIGGSIEEESLAQSIRKATGLNGSIDEIMKSIPQQSVLVFDGLELWWERSPQGLHFIQKLISLFNQYCSKILIIVTCRQLTHMIISQQTNLADLSIQHIKLNPMNSLELQQAILLRHRTTGFALQLGRSSPVALSMNRQARLFSRLFKQSGGNIGSALLLWISAITDVKNKTVFVHTPKAIDLSPLHSLDPALKHILLQFILHKQMGIEKLKRVTQLETEGLHESVQFLKRAGIIVESTGALYELDSFLLNQLYTVFRSDLFNNTANNPSR